MSACTELPYVYTCDQEVVARVTDEDAPIPELGDLSMADIAARLDRDETATFGVEFIGSGTRELAFTSHFQIHGPGLVYEVTGGDGPACDDRTSWLELPGTLTMSIDGTASTSYATTLTATEDDASADAPADTEGHVQHDLDDHFSGCSGVAARLGIGHDVAALGFTAECTDGVVGGTLLVADLAPRVETPTE